MKLKHKIATVFVLTTLNLHACSIDDADIIAITILGEVASDGIEGMNAVACVIQQRAIERKLTPARVCLQPKQFSSLNKGLDFSLLNTKEASYAIKLARILRDSIELDRSFVGFANHYCTLKARPYWARGKKPVKIRGNHKFYKL